MTAAKLADEAATTGQLADSAVTSAKMAEQSVKVGSWGRHRSSPTVRDREQRDQFGRRRLPCRHPDGQGAARRHSAATTVVPMLRSFPCRERLDRHLPEPLRCGTDDRSDCQLLVTDADAQRRAVAVFA